MADHSEEGHKNPDRKMQKTLREAELLFIQKAFPSAPSARLLVYGTPRRFIYMSQIRVTYLVL